ncbi:MAG: hypothetical protein ACYDHM_08810 [Acidiferrobacterales bacterium]
MLWISLVNHGVFGRRVHLAAVLMLTFPPGSSSNQGLRDLFTIPARTLRRWRTW